MSKVEYIKRLIFLKVMKAFNNIVKKNNNNSPLPIILIDNVNKTISPAASSIFVISLANELKKLGIKPNVWINKKNTRQTVLLSNDSKKPSSVNIDEFIISRNIPTWLGSKMLNVMRLASNNGGNVLIAFGTYESLGIQPNFSISLIDIDSPSIEETFSGNSLYKLTHTDAVVVLGLNESSYEIPELHRAVYKATWNISCSNLENKKLLGITRSDYSRIFYNLLTKSCSRMSGFIPISEKYSEKQLNTILQIAKSQEASLVTTDKDFIFFPKNFKKNASYTTLNINLEEKLLKEILRVYNQNNDLLEEEMLFVKSA